LNFTELNIKGLVLAEPIVHGDERGYFLENYRESLWAEQIETVNFVQENESLSGRGVFRGFHYQIGDFCQGKLVRVIQGSVVDYIVDIRRSSPTFGKMTSVELTAENKMIFYVPKGCAHAFYTLEDQTIFQYKVTAYYDKSSERGFRPDSPEIIKEFPELEAKLQLSEKDRELPFYRDAELFP
jgi:dTDP-4-dehydrorhamnose 3,5-epimerase